jgi:hypothetical protein
VPRIQLLTIIIRNEIAKRNDTDVEAEPLLGVSTSDRALTEDARLAGEKALALRQWSRAKSLSLSLADAVGRKEQGAPGEDDSIRELPLTHYYSLTGYAAKQRIVRRVNELIISFHPPSVWPSPPLALELVVVAVVSLDCLLSLTLTSSR